MRKVNSSNLKIDRTVTNKRFSFKSMQRVLSRAFPSTSSSVSTASPFIVDRRPPPDLGKWANFKRFIWNKEKHMFCNRTCSSWCKIISFYLIFLTLMLGLFFLLMLGSTQYIRDHYQLPWIDKKSLTEGGNPGVGFIPNIIRADSPLLWYTTRDNRAAREDMKYPSYVRNIQKYFRMYDEAENNKNNYTDCAVSKNSNKPCLFTRGDMGPCGIEEFGYPNKKPCVYIKINKMPEWTPKFYNGDDLPEDMPHNLKTVIKADSNKEKLWIHCGGLFPSDADHVGAVSYYPHQGIMGYYFPYTGHKNYLTPLVAVKFDNIKKGFVTNVRCSAWAKNIQHTDPKTYSAFIQMYFDID